MPVATNSLEYPTGPGTGFRVVFDVLNGKTGWTVLAYEGARTRYVSGVGIVSEQMAHLIAMRLSL